MVSLSQDDLIPIQLVSMNLCYQDTEVNFQMRELQYGKKITIELQKGHPKAGLDLSGSSDGRRMEAPASHPHPREALKA